MEHDFEQEKKYYRDNHAKLVKEYLGKLIAIKGNEVLCVVTDHYTGLKLQNSGQVLLELVTPYEPYYRYGDYVKVN